ncbi:hypothetical protein GJAV_G00199070 [Gymnothorax javanicus]|nr:hypothetical protein GJAV_G00199070 [Gymnothorax javanicus]
MMCLKTLAPSRLTESQTGFIDFLKNEWDFLSEEDSLTPTGDTISVTELRRSALMKLDLSKQSAQSHLAPLLKRFIFQTSLLHFLQWNRAAEVQYLRVPRVPLKGQPLL